MTENDQSVNTPSAYEGHGDHYLPVNTYLGVFGALVCLTVLTVWVAQYHFGAWNGLIAMGIATLKASLVVMYFMGAKYDNKLYVIILLGAVTFLFLFFGFSMFDIDTRVLEHSTL